MPSRISLSVSNSAARSANSALCGGTGRSQISKCCWRREMLGSGNVVQLSWMKFSM
jgi:hypothetical protein